MAKKETVRRITPADIAAARNLKRLWNAWKKERIAAGEPHNETWAGGELGWTQGAVNQYLNGNLVLHFEAVLKFAALLRSPPALICDDFDYKPVYAAAAIAALQHERRADRRALLKLVLESPPPPIRPPIAGQAPTAGSAIPAPAARISR